MKEQGSQSKSWKNNMVNEKQFELDFPKNGELAINVKTRLYKIMRKLVEKLQNENQPRDLVRLSFDHPELYKAIHVPLREISHIDENYIMGNVERVLQSTESLPIDNEFIVNVGVIHIPQGSSLFQITDIREARFKKRSVVAIRNNDTLCFARAVVIGQAYLKGQLSTYLLLRKYEPTQKRAAVNLHRKAKVNVGPVGFVDIPKFENCLKMNIVVFAANYGNSVAYKNLRYKKTVYLWLTENYDNRRGHYDLVLKPAPFLNKRHFCDICLFAYNVQGSHVCKTSCFCGLKKCIQIKNVVCENCNRTCKSLKCFKKHKTPRKKASSICDMYKMCVVCKKVYKRQQRHTCGEWYCRICQQNVNGILHNCYIRACLPKAVGYKYIDFDFETTTDDNGEHIPNFVVAFKSCETCGDVPTLEKQTCDQCGSRVAKFMGLNTKTQFCKWLFHKRHKNYTLRSHNGSGFDNSFLLQYLIQESIIPQIIYNGSKIMYMRIRNGLNIRVIDSMKFLPMRLADLPKAFDLNELKKGYFPHKFNTMVNQHYIGPYPSKDMYGYNEMKEHNRSQFEIWYNEKLASGEIFDFRKEIDQYCTSDVDILQRSCMEFRNLILTLTAQTIPEKCYDMYKSKHNATKQQQCTSDYSEHSDSETNDNDINMEQKVSTLLTLAVDPFQYISIAGVCMAIFKYKFLREKCLVTHKNTAVYAYRQGLRYYLENGVELGYIGQVQSTFISTDIVQVNRNTAYSNDSIVWMRYINKDIRHMLSNGGEVCIPNGRGGYYKLDGYDSNTNTVYEYYGCLWHGCQSCFPRKGFVDILHPYTKQPLPELRRQTQEREDYIKSKGFNYVSIWEHEFKKNIKEDRHLKQFYKSTIKEIKSRIDPRDAFYGGRTELMYTDYTAQTGEKIHYVDFTSLYPFINKYSMYPTGHPRIITNPRVHKHDIRRFFGIAKVDILPPRGLFIPVLPYKVNSKLLFPLCHTCCTMDATRRQSVCKCTDTNRVLHGTWITAELQKAIEKGYKILKIYEIYHWETKGQLFSQYVDTFLKFKQEASGWPSWVKDKYDKETYINQYYNREGVVLDANNICNNSGLRCVSKLALNSFW